MKKTSIFLLVGLAACGSDKSKPVAGEQPLDQNQVLDPNKGTLDPNQVANNPAPNPNPGMTPGQTGFDEVGAASFTLNPLDSAKTYTGETIVRSGRMVADGANWKFNWAGTSFTCRPQAASVTIGITVPDATVTSSQYLDVFIDGKLQPTPVQLAKATTSYKLALPDTAPHIVTWVLRTEANYGTGIMTFTGITAEGGNLLPTETLAAAPRQIEFIGDSITNGYGARSLSHSPVLGRDSACTVDGTYTGYKQDSTTESASLGFALLTSHKLSAKYSLVASSGRGAYRNRATTSDPGGTNTPTMSTMYPYTLHPYDSDITGANITGSIPAWDAAAATAAKWSPQVVVINLGTNDYSRHGIDAANGNNEAYPVDSSQFTAAYGALLTKVHGLYPSAKIIPMVGPMLSTTNKAMAQAAINAAITAVDSGNTYVTPLLDVGVQAVDSATDTGCEFHPLPSKHAEVAGKLADAITAAVPNW